MYEDTHDMLVLSLSRGYGTDMKKAIYGYQKG